MFGLLNSTKRKLYSKLQLTVLMIDPARSQRNKLKPQWKGSVQCTNKQNINHKNQGSCNPSQKPLSFSQGQMHELQILKESAISALVEKQEIIQSLIECDHTSLLEEIEELAEKVKELELQNNELRNSLEETVGTLHNERQEWNIQYFKLMEEIDELKDRLTDLQTTTQQTLKKNGELLFENQQVWKEINDMKTAPKFSQKQIKNQQERQEENTLKYRFGSLQDHQIEPEYPISSKTELYSYQEVNFEEFPSSKNIQSLIHKQKNKDQPNQQIYKQILSYETQQWLEYPSIENSIHQQHCLGRSIKAIHLIDNYSLNSKYKAVSDCESQFTSKYFIYTNDHQVEKAAQDDCSHIPEQPEEQLLVSEHKIEKNAQNSTSISAWLERAACLTIGVCVGAIIAWKR